MKTDIGTGPLKDFQLEQSVRCKYCWYTRWKYSYVQCLFIVINCKRCKRIGLLFLRVFLLVYCSSGSCGIQIVIFIVSLYSLKTVFNAFNCLWSMKTVKEKTNKFSRNSYNCRFMINSCKLNPKHVVGNCTAIINSHVKRTIYSTTVSRNS